MAKAATAPEAPAVYGFSAKGGKKNDARVETLPYSRVHVQPDFNPRKKLGDIEGLSAAIKADGLIHFPTVRPDPLKEGHYWIVSGERRFRAVGSLGWDTIPVVIREDLAGDDLKAKAVAMAENGDGSTRVPLTHMERGAQYRIFADQGWPVKKIAKECAAHERDVRRCLDLIQAPEDVQAAFAKEKLNFSTALVVAALDEETRKAAIKQFTEEGEEASQAKIKAFAKEFNKGEDTAPTKANNRKSGKSRAAALKSWKGKKEMEETLAELCFTLVSSEDDVKGTSTYYELRGAIGAILWARTDVSYPVMTPEDLSMASNQKEAKKELKRINDMIEAYAMKHTPEVDPNAPAETQSEAAAEPEEAEAAEVVGAAE